MTQPTTAGEPPADGVRWLDEDEARTWRTFLECNRALFAALEGQLQAESQIPLAYYDILVSLSEAPDHALRMGSLAAETGSSSSRLSHAISRLEQCGWIRRESHPSDRRGQVAVLTNEGMEALTAAAPGHVQTVRDVLIEALTPDQRTALEEISLTICTAIQRHASQSSQRV
jgi:DNA-binding MarR family transcriptional regulator